MAALLIRACLTKQLSLVRSSIFGVKSARCFTNDPGQESGRSESSGGKDDHGEYKHESSQTEQAQTEEDHGYTEEEQIKGEILTAALEYVPQLGWCSEAISSAAKDLGLSQMSEGMFPRGGGDLVLYFVEGCNLDLSEWLQDQSRVERKDNEPRPSTETIIKNSLEYRLRMITPYIREWPQAMGLMIQPQNAPDAVEQVKFMVDEIWYHSGDTSTDVNWYVKRGILAGVYGATELYMVQDKSDDFRATWEFLDRRLWEISTCIKSKDLVQKAGSDTLNIVSAAFKTARNMTGFNERKR